MEEMMTAKIIKLGLLKDGHPMILKGFRISRMIKSTKKQKIQKSTQKTPNLKTGLWAGFGICGCFNSTFLH